ncbi:MAG: hypothetical protein OXG15_06125 [Gammaproteobacteria bacterium]|nr:hypothetical protein [Gammaproteobacteria bacterium]
MALLSDPRRFVQPDPSDVEEIFQYEQTDLSFQWQQDDGTPLDISHTPIRTVAEFWLADIAITTGEDNDSITINSVTTHPNLRPRQLNTTSVESQLENGQVYVRLPADLWPEEIAYNLTEGVPLVILNLMREHYNPPQTLQSRVITKAYYIIRPAQVTGTV